jgi:methionine synthase II (cobalamin-independent)
MLEELAALCASIPHDQLAVQWDVAVEFGILEGVWPVYFSNVRDEIVERLLRLGQQVPSDVEMGFHLCYGDAGHQHFKQPEDTAKLVDIANAVSGGVARQINWIHLPVPIERDDDAYYEPLRRLQLHPETELYLGLVHIADGLDGSRRRAEVAARHVSNFGVATECGFGRRPAATVPELLKIHAQLAAPVR